MIIVPKITHLSFPNIKVLVGHILIFQILNYIKIPTKHYLCDMTSYPSRRLQVNRFRPYISLASPQPPSHHCDHHHRTVIIRIQS